jgi:hypothetical protein
LRCQFPNLASWHQQLRRPEIAQALFAFVGFVREELDFRHNLIEKGVADFMGHGE